MRFAAGRPDHNGNVAGTELGEGSSGAAEGGGGVRQPADLRVAGSVGAGAGQQILGPTERRETLGLAPGGVMSGGLVQQCGDQFQPDGGGLVPGGPKRGFTGGQPAGAER